MRTIQNVDNVTDAVILRTLTSGLISLFVFLSKHRIHLSPVGPSYKTLRRRRSLGSQSVHRH